MQVDPEVLYQVFKYSYSPNGQERRQAEAFLEEAAFKRGLLPALLKVTNEAQEVPIRQAAAIQLKNQLQSWETLGLEPDRVYTEEDKAPVRDQLVDSLIAAVGEKGVRVQLAECFRLVALYDFPENWPGMVEKLVACLRSERSAETMCSLLLLRQLLKITEMRAEARRQDLESVATQCMPALLQLSPVLVQAALAKSEEAYEMLKLVLKCFYSCIRMALPAQVQKDIRHWMELLLTISEWKIAAPAAGLEQQVREASCEAKCRKWVFQILLRFYQKHSHTRRVPEHLEAFAKAWNEAYEVPVASACIKEVCLPQGAWAPKKSLSVALLCLAEACRREAAFEALKPNLQQLLEHGIFPQVRFGEAELQMWHEDPEELLRKLLSDVDSDSEPHQAALDLVERLLLYHHKDILLPLLQFCHRHLENEAKDPAALSNQDGALVLLGLMAEYLVELDPLQDTSKGKKRKGKSKAQETVSIEELINRYVRPAMTSPVGFLRLRGAWCLGHFANKVPKLGRPGVTAGACCDCLRMLGDQELPIRVVAASCLEALLSREDDEEVLTAVGLQLAPAMEALLRTMTDAPCQEVGSTLQSLVESFPQEVVPFAIQLVATLANQFRQSDGNSHSELMSLDNTLATIVSVLQACAGLQRPQDPREQQRRCALFGSLAEPLMPVVVQALQVEGIRYLEEGLDMLSYLTGFCTLPIPAKLWEPFPLIFQAVCGGSTAKLQLPKILENGWAPDHMSNMLEPLLNYVARGPDVILTGSWPEGNRNYAEMIFCMVKKVLHIPGLGAEQDAAAAAELGAALFVYTSAPAADAWLGPYLCEFWTRLSGETGTHQLRRALLVALATLLWYNPELFLRCAEEKGLLPQLFEVWMQKISAVQRREHRKVTLLAFLQLFRLGCSQALPPNVAQGLPHLVQSMALQSNHILQLQQKAPKPEVTDHPERGTEDAVPNGGGPEIEEILQKIRGAPDPHDEEEEEDSEASEDEDDFELEGKMVDFQAQRPSALEAVQELAVLRQMLREAPGPMQQQVNTWVGGNLQSWLQQLDSSIASNG